MQGNLFEKKNVGFQYPILLNEWRYKREDETLIVKEILDIDSPPFYLSSIQYILSFVFILFDKSGAIIGIASQCYKTDFINQMSQKVDIIKTCSKGLRANGECTTVCKSTVVKTGEFREGQSCSKTIPIPYKLSNNCFES
jgi:hypothetical protein